MGSFNKRATTKCTGSKQKCEKPVNTFHNMSVVLATVIPVVCVIILVSCIIIYLWRKHKREEALGEEFDNKVEEDLDELYYKEEHEDVENYAVTSGHEEEQNTVVGSSESNVSTSAATKRDNSNTFSKRSRLSFRNSSRSDNYQVNFKEKGRLAIMRQRMKELENQSRIGGKSTNASSISLAALGAHDSGNYAEELSFIQPPGLKRQESDQSLTSNGSKKSNMIMSNDSLNIPIIPSSPSSAHALSTKNSFLNPKVANSGLTSQAETTDQKNEKVDSILLNSNRLEDVSEQDMREYMRHYDKIMGISGLENMNGSFPGGRVPSGILQQGKFFPKNPYNKNNNTSAALKNYLNPPKSSLNKFPINAKQSMIVSKVDNDDDSAISDEVFGTPTEPNHLSVVNSTNSEKSILKSGSVEMPAKILAIVSNTVQSNDEITGNNINEILSSDETKSPKEILAEQDPFLSDAEKQRFENKFHQNINSSNNSLNEFLNNDVNKSMIKNLRHTTDSGLLEQVERFNEIEVSKAMKDIDETEDKDDIILSSEQEENLKRLKSVYKIYMEKNAEDDANLEAEEEEDQFGEMPNVSHSSDKIKKHTSSIYSDFANSKKYILPSSEQHALPNYDLNEYNTSTNTHHVIEDSSPNPELFADYYELDPSSEQYYYYDGPSGIHYYFDPVSQQYYYYDEKAEQYFCNIDNQVYYYDSINHIPYYYDDEQGGYFYLGQPDLGHTQFQQEQLIQPNLYRNSKLEQHIIEREEDHPEIMENMQKLMNPASMDGSTTYSMTNFNRSSTRKVTPHKQLQKQMSQVLAFDPLDNRKTSYNQSTSQSNTSVQSKDTPVNNTQSAAYKLSRESVVMTDPLQFSGAKTKFRPAGSIRNLSSYITNNNHDNF
ncbi:hypothetical protein QEN19_002572 [Hanseniaspora menglaensis]